MTTKNKLMLAALTTLAFLGGLWIGINVSRFLGNWSVMEQSIIAVIIILLGLGWGVLAFQLSFWSYNRTYARAMFITFLAGVVKITSGVTMLIRLY
ncbi:hypothetical protein MOC16_gp246 [Klebsiella phage vB_KpM_FBKp24]|uniref:Uncharacterized protein n=1 Tax=Klebsiella phage vB_KpM_FBKp24 TaxID=2801834 RepID=A0A7U0J797_9CAUD|nr:hypothetical protein [Klebsiella pneumoniae]YP_010298804.1 hypothetical protein MOC16_gp246 [Klebsiella phage vB_KpM_FBKp24]QQV92307.1 hypothetical protein vBKpMFBKp24_167 [Klebsiella phage vB_KpM_FBKp24]